MKEAVYGKGRDRFLWLYKGLSIPSAGIVIFSYPKYFRYEDPQLSYKIEGYEIAQMAIQNRWQEEAAASRLVYAV